MADKLAGLTENIYNFFYRKFYNKPNFRLDLELNKNSLQIQNFIDLLARHYQLESISVNFLINYIGWSFSRRYGQITKRDISLNWIIGKKTFQKFLEKKEQEQYHVDQFVNKIGVNVEQLKYELLEKEAEDKGLDPAEEIEKERFNGELRLANCLQWTTLYNHRSTICFRCENKILCKKLLSTTFPRLFKKRGYLNGKQIE